MAAVILGTICALFVWQGVMCRPAPATSPCPGCGRAMTPDLPRAAGGVCTKCADDGPATHHWAGASTRPRTSERR